MMKKNKILDKAQIEYVAYLPDLITEEDYKAPPNEQKVRVQIKVTEDGIQILGDSIYASLLENILTDLGSEKIERMLCG